MLEFLQKLPLSYIPILVAQFVQIHILIPRGHRDSGRLRFGGELQRGYRICRRGGHDKLIYLDVSREILLNLLRRRLTRCHIHDAPAAKQQRKQPAVAWSGPSYCSTVVGSTAQRSFGAALPCATIFCRSTPLCIIASSPPSFQKRISTKSGVSTHP